MQNDLHVQSDGITINGDFYPKELVTGAAFEKKGVALRQAFGGVILSIVAFYSGKITSFFGWCFGIGAAGLFVGAFMPLIIKEFFITIHVNGEWKVIFSQDEEWTIKTVNRINSLNKEDE